MYKIIDLHKSISGSLVNFLDLAEQPEFMIGFENYLSYLENLKMSKRQYKIVTNRLFHLEKDLVGNLVMDFYTLMMLVRKGYNIHAKNLIVFDCFELTVHLRNIKHDLYFPEKIDELPILYDNIQFNVTPFIYDDFKKMYPDIPVKKNFKKINVNALKTIRYHENRKAFSRVEKEGIDHISNMKLQNIYNYSSFYYFRRPEINFIEQFGRLIFEFKILGKNVILPEDFFETKDGVVDYYNEYWEDIEKINMRNYTTKELLCI